VDRYLLSATPIANADFGLTSIVILTHNQLPYTRLCVESLRLCTVEPHELIFVDNASTDGTVEYLRSLGSKVINNDTNRGFPAAVNQGIQASSGQQILLLNNDCIVTTGWLGESCALSIAIQELDWRARVRTASVVNSKSRLPTTMTEQDWTGLPGLGQG